jgi:class 3 adenylate cyclase/tetratricopeptide (TPR) repeat protein
MSFVQGQDIKELLSSFENAKEDEVRTLYGLQVARAYYKDNQVENALKYYSKVENIERKKSKPQLAPIYEEMGNVYQSWQGYDRSLHYFGEANKLYEAQNDSKGQKNCLRQMAWSNFKIGQYQDAQKYYENLLKIHMALGERPQQADIYTRLAVIAEMRKQYQEAIGFSEKALAIQQANQDYEGTAKTYNNLGVLYRKLGEPKKSVANFNQAIDLYKTQINISNNKGRKAQLFSNMGVVYTNLQDFGNALRYHEEALALREQQKNAEAIANVHNEIATNHFLNKNNERAKIAANKAIKIAEPINDWEILYDSYTVLANIFKSEGNLQEYETYSKLIAKAQREVDKKNSQHEQELLNKKFAVQNFDNSLKLANTEEEKQRLEKESAEKEARASKAQAEAERQKALAAQAQAETQRAEAERARAIAERAERDRQIALAKEQQAKQEKELAEAKVSEEEAKKARAIAEKQTAEAQRAQAQAEAEQAKKDKEKLEAEQKNRNQLFLFSTIIGFIALVLIFIIISYIRNRQKNRLLRKQNDKIKEQNVSLEQQKEEIEAQRDAIIEEQRKSDALLLNILPVEVAKELKESGHATPKYYESATVLFTDFKGFTNAASKMTPQEVIKALDICFMAFDEISEKYNLEKIKTIGDAYMCAGGVPIVNTSHAIDAVRAGIEIQAFMNKIRQEKEAKGEPFWEVRVGINTGALVAGVVGKKKFAYDIWGDTVNLASRMESSGEPGRVNISGFTYELVKDHFEVTYRGKVPAKNKGDVDMYFVDRWKG